VDEAVVFVIGEAEHVAVGDEDDGIARFAAGDVGADSGDDNVGVRTSNVSGEGDQAVRRRQQVDEDAIVAGLDGWC